MWHPLSTRAPDSTPPDRIRVYVFRPASYAAMEQGTVFVIPSRGGARQVLSGGQFVTFTLEPMDYRVCIMRGLPTQDGLFSGNMHCVNPRFQGPAVTFLEVAVAPDRGGADFELVPIEPARANALAPLLKNASRR
jgi:hypothetical protein